MVVQTEEPCQFITDNSRKEDDIIVTQVEELDKVIADTQKRHAKNILSLPAHDELGVLTSQAVDARQNSESKYEEPTSQSHVVDPHRAVNTQWNAKYVKRDRVQQGRISTRKRALNCRTTRSTWNTCVALNYILKEHVRERFETVACSVEEKERLGQNRGQEDEIFETTVSEPRIELLIAQNMSHHQLMQIEEHIASDSKVGYEGEKGLTNLSSAPTILRGSEAEIYYQPDDDATEEDCPNNADDDRADTLFDLSSSFLPPSRIGDENKEIDIIMGEAQRQDDINDDERELSNISPEYPSRSWMNDGNEEDRDQMDGVHATNVEATRELTRLL